MAQKDFSTFTKRKNILYSLVVVPLLISVLLPGVTWYILHKGSGAVTPAELVVLMPAFTFFYLVVSGLIPTTLASYAIVGEKVEKSLEPLLATPTTDGEILVGKGVAAFFPTIGCILGGGALFMALTDFVTRDALGYYYFPNWNAVVVLFLLVPLAVLMSVEWNVLVSSRVTDVRIAQQVGMLLILPLGAVYVMGEMGVIPLGDTDILLALGGILAVADLLLLSLTRETFRRDEILTRWR